MSLLQKRLVIGVILLGVLVLSSYSLYYVKKEYRSELLGSPLAQRMIPTYRSLRKLPDIVFMPWAAFATTNLDTYEISISPKNIERMNAALPESPFHTALLDENKLWVSAYFRTEGYEGNVKIRYRGNLPSHWNAYQKSYSIKFDKDNLFQGQRRMNLVIPSDRRYIDMPLNSYRAEKLGLIHPDESLVRLEVNGAETGILLAFEGWSQPWIEKMPMSSLSTIYGLDDEANGMSYEDRWISWNAEEPVDFTPLETLQETVDHADDETFKKIIPQLIDIEDWYALEVMHILASGYHGGGDTSFGANNLVLIFDKGEGRFKPVPYNTIIYTPSNRAMTGTPGIAQTPPNLFQRILSIPEFRDRRDEVFAEYVKNEKDDDLLFVKNWKKTYNREFLLDNGKNDNHFMYLAKINESAQAIFDHFDDPFGMLQTTHDVPVEVNDILTFPSSFKYLEAASTGPLEASKQHPGLLLNNGELLIPAGNHYITKTIIISANTHLTIAPGAILHMSEGVSLISYSPVTAEGTEYRPIKITGATQDTAWGVFAVLNTNTATSSLSYIIADNGGEDTINGAYISGTIALHNADGSITHTTVSDANGDDGINIKGGLVEITNSTLDNNSSDGVDLDYVHKDSIFSSNVLTNNHGDAIDISWSDLNINDNTIFTCKDKGISVGEKSHPVITKNNIINCAVGIAVKDSSVATATKNTLVGNGTAFSLYKKKPYFSGGTLTASGNTLFNNTRLLFTDELSISRIDENGTTTSLNLDTIPLTLHSPIKEYLLNLKNSIPSPI